MVLDMAIAARMWFTFIITAEASAGAEALAAVQSSSITITDCALPTLIVCSYDRHLQDGEFLLWQDKPRVPAYTWPKALRDAVLILPIILIAMWQEALRPGAAVAVGLPAFWVIGLIASAFGT